MPKNIETSIYMIQKNHFNNKEHLLFEYLVLQNDEFFFFDITKESEIFWNNNKRKTNLIEFSENKESAFVPDLLGAVSSKYVRILTFLCSSFNESEKGYIQELKKELMQRIPEKFI